ncbi:hypothetical protein [Mycolicibacterium gilvum]|uniref:Uncharacterized protein n=1 Tax=Mycolicibacterium gilvum TaxID=1804 RepID=A0A378SKH3_9MYCO|nr:hypothetical protein [Mycolicibacterium gilvum]MCV7053607.1 hypothetical protein [Mycolicibacterium gilvum]STZ43200.1 Uncharacterised protein [Mycolicibacterium gilvum]
MSAQADDVFALARLDLAHEANAMLTTLRYEDLTGGDLAALVAILRTVNERRQARVGCPVVALSVVRDGKR